MGKCPSLAGAHSVVAEGVFAQLMKELGIPRPEDVPRGEKVKIDWFRPTRDAGKSSLNNWKCPECGIHARMGIKGNPEIRHDPCEKKTGHAVFFIRADGLAHEIYKATEPITPIKVKDLNPEEAAQAEDEALIIIESTPEDEEPDNPFYYEDNF